MCERYEVRCSNLYPYSGTSSWRYRWKWWANYIAWWMRACGYEDAVVIDTLV